MGRDFSNLHGRQEEKTSRSRLGPTKRHVLDYGSKRCCSPFLSRQQPPPLLWQRGWQRSQLQPRPNFGITRLRLLHWRTSTWLLSIRMAIQVVMLVTGFQTQRTSGHKSYYSPFSISLSASCTGMYQGWGYKARVLLIHGKKKRGCLLFWWATHTDTPYQTVKPSSFTNTCTSDYRAGTMDESSCKRSHQDSGLFNVRVKKICFLKFGERVYAYAPDPWSEFIELGVS